jgi:hypothetical protein
MSDPSIGQDALALRAGDLAGCYSSDLSQDPVGPARSTYVVLVFALSDVLRKLWELVGSAWLFTGDTVDEPPRRKRAILGALNQAPSSAAEVCWKDWQYSSIHGRASS